MVVEAGPAQAQAAQEEGLPYPRELGPCVAGRRWGQGLVPADEDASPLTWPPLSVSVDQESSNVAALAYATRELKCNIDMCGDPSHGCWNDVRKSINMSGDWPFMLTLLASWRLKHEPFSQDMRLWQITQCLGEYARMAGPQCPWWKECAPLIAKDRHEEHLLLEPGYLSELFKEINEDRPQRSKKGTRPTLNRFMSLIREGRREVRWWHSRRHNQIVVCILEGLLSHAKIQNFIDQRARVRTVAQLRAQSCEQQQDKTPLMGATAEENAFRAAAQNLLVMSSLILDDDVNGRLLKLIIHVDAP